MNGPTIVVPSRGRAGKVITGKTLPSAVLVVPGAEVDRYRDAHPSHEIVAQPDDVRGLAATRQWILEHFGDVFMADDDVNAMHDWTAGRGETSIVKAPRSEEIIWRTWDTARQMGVHLWGFGVASGPMEYSPHHPFRLRGWVNCGAMGVMGGTDLWFRPDLSLVDDFWISGLNAHLHRWAFVDERYRLSQQGTFKTAGGLAQERSMERAKAAFFLLREAFGPVIQPKVDGRGRLGRRIHQPGHRWMPMMEMPY